MRRLTSALTYSNVVATAALFLALSGGVAYAATSLGKNAVKSHNIAANAVKARNLSKNSVKRRSIVPHAVGNKNLAGNAVTGSKIAAENDHRHEYQEGWRHPRQTLPLARSRAYR